MQFGSIARCAHATLVKIGLRHMYEIGNSARVQNWFFARDYAGARFVSPSKLVLCAVVLCIILHSDVSLENVGMLGYYVRFFPLYRISQLQTKCLNPLK